MDHTVCTPNGIVGNLVTRSDRHEICLRPDKLFKIADAPRGLQIICRRGKLWITQADDEQDHILCAGERFIATRQGLILVQSFGEGVMQLISPSPSPFPGGIQ